MQCLLFFITKLLSIVFIRECRQISAWEFDSISQSFKNISSLWSSRAQYSKRSWFSASRHLFIRYDIAVCVLFVLTYWQKCSGWIQQEILKLLLNYECYQRNDHANWQEKWHGHYYSKNSKGFQLHKYEKLNKFFKI